MNASVPEESPHSKVTNGMPSSHSHHADATVMQRLDPRRRLAAAIGWSVFAITALLALAAATLAASAAERSVRDDTERLLTQFAMQVHHGLAMSLETRRSIVQATAAQLAASHDHGTDALRRHLQAVQDQFPEFAWLGMADTRGHVMAATGAASAPGLPQPSASDGLPLRFIDVAAPLAGADGRNVGVLGAHLSWDWVQRLPASLLRGVDTQRKLELLLADSDGTVLIGPADWLGRKLGGDADLTEKGTRVVGLRAGSGDELHWTVAVRQDASLALAPARDIRHTVFLVVLLAGLASAFAAVWVTRMLTRRLAVLAAQTRDVQRGTRQSLTVPAGHDEVSRIGMTLAETIDQLQQEKGALARLNVELDARVVQRTARIERLAEEARHAAVTRERLRLARDLHDTLAHSLMAVLTQMRLVRKLQGRLAPEELDAELERAESVAASGLTEARAAIAQMRHNGVRDTGLAAALRELLERFDARTGIACTLEAAPAMTGLADERAETVFRITEEVLNNVQRHAQARSVQVVLKQVAPLAGEGGDADTGAGPRARIEIADDGVGFDVAAPRPGHYGLRGIEEQAALIGAQLQLRSRPGEGTRVALEFEA